jgi:hypothetical protein
VREGDQTGYPLRLVEAYAEGDENPFLMNPVSMEAKSNPLKAFQLK